MNGVPNIDWDGDLATEWRQRNHPDRPLFVGWHNVEYFDIKPSRSQEFYPPVPDWWPDFEPTRILNAPTPPILSYASNFYFRGPKDIAEEKARRSGLMAVAMSEFVVRALVRFLMAARDRVVCLKLDDPRLNVFDSSISRPSIGLSAFYSLRPVATGVLVPLPASLVEAIVHFGVFELVLNSRFDAARSLFALEQS